MYVPRMSACSPSQRSVGLNFSESTLTTWRAPPPRTGWRQTVARPDKIESALLDASSLIGVVQGEEEFACLKSLLAAVDRGTIKLVESTSILTEVLPHHARDTETHRRAREGVLALL